LGAKSIWTSQSNSACTTHWGLNQTYLFIYLWKHNILPASRAFSVDDNLIITIFTN
jgi:hypothetical protein